MEFFIKLIIQYSFFRKIKISQNYHWNMFLRPVLKNSSPTLLFVPGLCELIIVNRYWAYNSESILKSYIWKFQISATNYKVPVKLNLLNYFKFSTVNFLNHTLIVHSVWREVAPRGTRTEIEWFNRELKRHPFWESSNFSDLGPQTTHRYRVLEGAPVNCNVNWCFIC